MTENHLHLHSVEKLLEESLAEVATQIRRQDHSDITEYIDHGEYGVAYEMLTFVVDRAGILRPATLNEVGKRMGMSL